MPADRERDGRPQPAESRIAQGATPAPTTTTAEIS
jgi:hypothetical protein